ncbi:alpha/beta hydrolase [Neglectibacter timonensis]|uniref:Alpha/beta hydrolase-fold protein n=2 Tax=Neglectibacter timonensis TaxID=1776382 RepID=A0ABT1S232_9FIRM|nr:alpha/beta hydrolase-fold protein [Neglectibacter timonensis]
MEGRMNLFSLQGRECACFVPNGDIKGKLPVSVLCGWGMKDKMPGFAEELPPMLLFFVESEGNRDFTPWPSPGLREEEFTGEAAGYLSFLTEAALPFLEEKFGATADRDKRALLGYSLGGLFALWAAGQTEAFGRYASLSGSLWYEGFAGYLREMRLSNGTEFYLSLGDREKFGGPPLLRTVGERTREAVSILSGKGFAVTMEWNRGGHGKGVDARWKKALHWAGGRLTQSGSH